MRRILLSIPLILVFFASSVQAFDAGPKIENLQISPSSWSNLSITADVKPAFLASGSGVPVRETVQIVTLSGDIIYEGSAHKSIELPDHLLGDREQLTVNFCAIQGNAKNCISKVIFASPKVAIIEAKIEYPFNNDVTKGRFELETKVFRTSFDDQSQVERIKNHGPLQARIVIQGADRKPFHVPVTTTKGIFDLKYRDEAKEFLQNQMNAIYDSETVEFNTSVTGLVSNIPFTTSEFKENALASITTQKTEMPAAQAARIIPIPQEFITPNVVEPKPREVVSIASEVNPKPKNVEKKPVKNNSETIVKSEAKLSDTKLAQKALGQIVKMVTSDPTRSAKVNVISSNQNGAKKTLKLSVSFIDKWTDAKMEVKGVLSVKTNGENASFTITSTNEEVKLMNELGDIKLKKNQSWASL